MKSTKVFAILLCHPVLASSKEPPAALERFADGGAVGGAAAGELAVGADVPLVRPPHQALEVAQRLRGLCKRCEYLCYNP